MYSLQKEKGERERRGEGRGREGRGGEGSRKSNIHVKENINGLPPIDALTGDQAHNLLVHETTLQPT